MFIHKMIYRSCIYYKFQNYLRNEEKEKQIHKVIANLTINEEYVATTTRGFFHCHTSNF